MEERECVFDVLLCGSIGGAFPVVRYQVVEFWTALNIHRERLHQSPRCAARKVWMRYRFDKWPEPYSHQSKRVRRIVIVVET
jgi:hypothetical protein